jgi:prepilin-type N-terminal cleavage/methylation domain-containing protein
VRRSQGGFTLIELMIVVVIIGVLASIAIPNFIAMQNRAKEGATKANMHTFQLTAEDYGIQFNGRYASSAGAIASLMPSAGTNFKNPFDQTAGSGNAWEDRSSMLNDPGPKSGLTSYADSSNNTYNIMGVGRVTSGVGFPMTVVLTCGQ